MIPDKRVIESLGKYMENNTHFKCACCSMEFKVDEIAGAYIITEEDGLELLCDECEEKACEDAGW